MRLEDVIWPNKYMLTVVGLWPIHPDIGLASRLFVHLRFIIGAFAMVCLFVPELMTVIVSWGDIKVLGDFGALAVVHFLAILKMLYNAGHRQSFNSVYQHIKSFWMISSDSQAREVYERMAHLAKMATIACILAGIADFFSFQAAVLINWMRKHGEFNESLQHRQLPIEFYYGFDTQRTPTYEIIFIWQSICMLYGICSVIGFDCTMMVFIIHISGQFKLIGHRFRKIGQKINEETLSNNELNDEIGRCIAQHQHAIRVTEDLKKLLSPVIFGQIVTSGMEICLSGYAVIEGESSGAEFVKFLVLFVSLMIQLVVWCVPAEILIQESTEIAEVIYHNIFWFKLTPRQQRDLRFVIMRAQKGCHVTALHQIMSIRKLTEVFNAAGSYMALLKSIKK